MERAIAEGKVDDEGLLLPDALTEEDKAPCAEPGSKRFDPYANRQLTSSIPTTKATP